MEYRVAWIIDVDAETPEEAAAQAETFLKTRGARVYEVTPHKRSSLTTHVDLDEVDER